MSAEMCEAVCRWLVSLDEPGNQDRRTVTLERIIRRAEGALTHSTEPVPLRDNWEPATVDLSDPSGESA